MKELTEEEVLNKMAAYCAAAERCRAEIIGKLQRWGVADDVAERVIEQLEQEGYLDEQRYCSAFVRDKYRFDKWGKKKIAQALQFKRIPSRIYQPCLCDIDEDEYLAILQKLLQAKRKSVRAQNEYELNGKLIRFALGRGFEMEDIRRCIAISDENEDFA